MQREGGHGKHGTAAATFIAIISAAALASCVGASQKNSAGLDSNTASAVAKHVVTGLANHDWRTLYGLLAPEVQGSFKSQNEFVSAVSASDGGIVDAQLTGSSTTSSAGGYSYYSQPLSLRVKDSSGVKAYSTTLYLVYEHGKWYFLGTDPPSSVA